MEIVEHPNCPVCGGIGEMHTITKKQVEGGFISDKVIPAAELVVSVTFDLTRPPIVGARLPAFRQYKDTCRDCGATWAFRVERGHVTFTGDPRQLVKDFK